jgi:hypothetical protein
MSSSGGGIGSTLTGGIQDVAAILPLLGTEQCSDQVSSALTRGYLYAAATPMSIFGSLGVVTAGFKTLVACFSFGDIEGAKVLGNMGFEPQGENLSLIMVEAGKGKNTGRYIIESRMDELIKELNIDKNRITGVSHKSAAWNVKMMATAALLCAFSITPYIFLNMGANRLEKSTTWIFPVLRASGGFITTTLIQLLIQRRITTLSDQYLVKRDQLPNTDVEAAVGNTKKHQMDASTWLLLCLLLIGLVGSIVGYVGCFSVVQNSTSNVGPVSWLCLEAGLSVTRLAIWASNPKCDDAPPLEIILELDKYDHKPLPTCNKDNEDILKDKVLPLTRARDFLKIITSFAGLVEPFGNPDLSLYYTLTRKRAIPTRRASILKKDIEVDSIPIIPCRTRIRKSELEGPVTERYIPVTETRKLGESILYITVFDHKERTTRVYTRDNDIDIFYSTKSDAPLVDVGHFVLEVEIDVEIDPKGDPVSSDSNNLDSLRKHHRSILEHIRYRLGDGYVTKAYAIENNWTMKVEDTISTLQREEENGDDWKMVVENGNDVERNEESSLISDYFKLSSIDKERRLLDEKRVKWIARKMEMIAEETKERFQGKMGVEYRVNKRAAEKKPATKSPEVTVIIEQQLFWERCMMELLLLYEVKGWEQLFWNKFEVFLDQIDQVEVKERLAREWRADCWKRLNPQMHAAQKRMADFGRAYHLGTVGELWASFISQFFGGVENPMISLSKIRRMIECLLRMGRLGDERMENEIEDIEFRLKRGSDLGRFDQFWDHDTVFQCRYSRSKWLNLWREYVPLEIYSHALKRNENIIHISFHNPNFPVERFQICDLPWVTSISSSITHWNSFDNDLPLLPAIHHGPLFIKSINDDLTTFAKEIRPKLNPLSTYIFTDDDKDRNVDSGKLGNNARVLISFVAPTSGQSLTLRLKHSGRRDGRPLEVTLGSTIIQLNTSSKSSLTIDDITLYPIPGPSESYHLSFEPGIRNDIHIQFKGPKSEGYGRIHGHYLHDIELLDEAGLEDPRNQIINAD